MDELIEDYKKKILDDINNGSYPAGLVLKVRREIMMNEFTIPVERVNEMLKQVRQEG